MDELADRLARMKGRWMTGGAALDQAPDTWRIAAERDEAPDLVLLALAGQASHVIFRPSPGAEFAPAKLLPRLSLPPLPDRLRPAFRRILHALKPDPTVMAMILGLMAARGLSAHPADWMPEDVDGLPAAYAPWAQWHSDRDVVDLTGETWDHLDGAERRREFRSLRARDPEAARDLLDAKVAEVPAEQRLKLVAELERGLSEADIPFLQSLGHDRSQKVQRLATGLLARLGMLADDAVLAEELAAFLARPKGIFSRGAIGPAPIKTAAQKARRRELFETVSLGGLAAALDLQSEDIPARWTSKESDLQATAGLASLIARTARDELVGPSFDRLLAEECDNLSDLLPLIERLTQAERTARMPLILRADHPTLPVSLAAAAAAPGRLPLPPLEESGAVGRLLDLARGLNAEQATRHGEADLTSGLTALGLLADADAATNLLGQFTAAGMILADPALLLLNFNAELNGDGA